MSDETGHLAYLGFRRFLPAPALRPFIQSYWTMQHPHAGGDREEFMHAGAGFGMIFNIGDDLIMNGLPIREKYYPDGANTQSRLVRFHGSIEVIGVRFKSGGAFPFFAIPLAEFMDRHDALDEYGIKSAPDIFEQLCAAPTLAHRIAVLDRWLLARLNPDAGFNPDVRLSLSMIQRSQGRLSIQQLADRVFLSQRQLERLFRAQVGITPKKYAGLLRVEAARYALKRPTLQTAAAISAAAGFYDQSHFIREFKAVVGMTPQEYARRSQQRQSDSPAES